MNIMQTSLTIRVTSVAALLALGLLTGSPAQAARRVPSSPGPMAAQAAFILDDVTGRTLYSFNADVERYPASTIKMLTAIVALQHLNLNAAVTIPPDATVGGTTANLAVGERITVRNLLYGLLLPSGNDAAATLADAVAGSSWAFVGMMNAEARSLHLWHTHALGPEGFDLAGEYSTARDLAWLAHALLRRSFLARVVSTSLYRATSVDRRYWHVWVNLNHLLGAYPGAIGVKTGTTPLAGANLVACAVRGRHRIIAVLLGSTPASRFADGTTLLNYGWRLLGA